MKKILKVNEQVLQQIKVRKVAFSSLEILAQVAKRELSLYVADELKKLGLETNEKTFNIDDNTGEVTEIKKELVTEK